MREGAAVAAERAADGQKRRNTRRALFAAGRAAARMAPTRRGSKLITRSGGSFAVGRKVRGSRRTQGIPEERGCAGRDARRRFRTQGRQAAASLGNDAAQELCFFAADALPRRGAKGTGARFSPGSRSAEGFFQTFSRRPGPEVTMPRSMRRRRYQFLSLTSMWS